MPEPFSDDFWAFLLAPLALVVAIVLWIVAREDFDHTWPEDMTHQPRPWCPCAKCREFFDDKK